MKRCRECGLESCMCSTRNAILQGGAEINAALRVVDYARRAVDATIKRDGVLHEIDLIALKEAIDSYDLLVLKRTGPGSSAGA